MPSTDQPVFIDARSLIQQLIQLKSADPSKKIAFVFSGGGARAGWFGGILEAIEREVRAQQPQVEPHRRFAPDILVGTSGGGLAAVGYFADLLHSGEYGPYANRQSWLWREISRGNEAALKLLDNPGMLELLSGSRTSKGQLEWDSIKERPLSAFMNIANLPNTVSPTYNFTSLIQSILELKRFISDIEPKWRNLGDTLEQLVNNAEGMISRINLQNLAAPWLSTISTATNSIANIKNQVNSIRRDVDYIREKLKPVARPDEVKDAFAKAKGLITEGNQLLIVTLNALNDLLNKMISIPVGIISSQLSDIQTLFTDTKKILGALHELHKAVGMATLGVAQTLFNIGVAIDDAITFLIVAGKMIADHSSLMNTTGLKNALHELLRLATPTPFHSAGSASDLDLALFDHWQSRRDAKTADPWVRAPELILTAANITANRLVALSVCDGQTAIDLAGAKKWVIAMNIRTGGFIRGQELGAAPGSNPSDPADPHHWVFGAWAPNNHHLIKQEHGERASFIVEEIADTAVNDLPLTPPSRKPTYASPAHCPFDQEPGKSQITGTSIVAGAALTTSAIPIAFPPRYWIFENPFLQKVYCHWFTDGGMCDNRPIEQALAAGADYIVSFELTPLRKAITDVPAVAPKPNLMGIASASLVDTPINSAFYRFLEEYVAANQPAPGQTPDKMIWRIAPEAAAGEEDETIGVYDFNGYWHEGNLRMGLFDWFMRGYLDGKNNLFTAPISKTDPVMDAYANMPEYRQMGNAAAKKTSPGFYVVDFVNNRPHPGYPEMLMEPVLPGKAPVFRR